MVTVAPMDATVTMMIKKSKTWYNLFANSQTVARQYLYYQQ
jgi:hypothetical protein